MSKQVEFENKNERLQKLMISSENEMTSDKITQSTKDDRCKDLWESQVLDTWNADKENYVANLKSSPKYHEFSRYATKKKLVRFPRDSPPSTATHFAMLAITFYTTKERRQKTEQQQQMSKQGAQKQTRAAK